MDNFFDLSGRVALVTGGNGGIGLGMAEGLAKHGCDICIWGTNLDKNAEALENLNQYGTKVTAQKCNVADLGEVESAFAETLKNHGRVDGCFANAGIGSGGVQFDQIEKEVWDRVIGVNLRSIFLATKFAVPYLRRSAAGRRVNIASVHAFAGGGPASASAKAGVVNLTRDAAVELAADNITVNSICPGYIETPIQDYLNEEIVEECKKVTPLPRLGVRRCFSLRTTRRGLRGRRCRWMEGGWRRSGSGAMPPQGEEAL